MASTSQHSSYILAEFFARMLCGDTGRACIGFLSLLQEVRAICKTYNSFSMKRFMPCEPVSSGPWRGRTNASGCCCVLRASSSVTMSWLRVFRSPDAAHLGHGGGQARQTRALQSENCVARGGSVYDKMGMITTRFTRVLQRCAGSLCMHFLLILQ
jgi:hypothetical protein